MKIQIKNGSLKLTKEIIEKSYLPYNGECEVRIVETGVRLIPLNARPNNLIEEFKKPPIKKSIDKIMMDMEVENG